MDTIIYNVKQISGDYAYLENIEHPDWDLKCVARAMLPEEIFEGCQVKYEMFSYEMEAVR